jgi:hypothetical protein
LCDANREGPRTSESILAFRPRTEPLDDKNAMPPMQSVIAAMSGVRIDPRSRDGTAGRRDDHRDGADDDESNPAADRTRGPIERTRSDRIISRTSARKKPERRASSSAPA